MIIKLCLFVLWMILLPTVIGCLWTEKTPEGQGNVLAAFFYGLFFVLAIFEVLAVPMIFLKCSLSLLTYVWAGCVLLLALVSVVKNRSFPKQRRWLAGLWKKMTPVLLGAMACMLLQAGFVMEKQHIDDDDAFYLATSTTAVATDSLYEYSAYTGSAYKKVPSRYVLAAWPLFLAALSRLTSFHPTVLAHMILPGMIVLWAYVIYALFGARLFPGDKEKQALFLLFAVVLLSFSGYSQYSASTFLFIRSWQGKAVLAGVGLPALAYSAWITMWEKGGRAAWAMMSCIVASVCMFSTMGVALSLVLVGCCGFVWALWEKKGIRLAQSLLACFPALICGVVYVLLK